MLKRSPAEKDLYDRLGPSFSSFTGFLGTDPRDLEEIKAADADALVRLGLDQKGLVHALRDIYALALQAMGDPVEVAPGVVAECLECRGRVPSPFPGEGTFPKHQVKVVRQSSGECFLITGLSLHLIERHGFFQGQGCAFRIDPVLAASMLQLGRPSEKA